MAGTEGSAANAVFVDKSFNPTDQKHPTDPGTAMKVNLPESSSEPLQEPKGGVFGNPKNLPAGASDETPSSRLSSGRKSSISGSTTRIFPIRSEIGIDPLRSPRSLPRRTSSISYLPPKNSPAGGSEGHVTKANTSSANILNDGYRRDQHRDTSGFEMQVTSGRAGLTNFQSKETANLSPPRDRISIHQENNTGFIASRFKHIVTEEGHAIITGCNSAPLKRCEDEPIHIPGAIQGFGLLVALKEESGEQLVVRIVSENSHKVIGYTPQELFKLNSFSNILADEQRDNLLDHIEFIRGEELDPASNGPDVFPISVLSRDSPRITRKLWCAMHINPSNVNLIICEFELYDDELYPLVPLADMTLEVPEDTLNCDPTDEEYIESTFNHSKPLRVLRSARKRKGEAATMEIYNIMAQVQDQLASAPNLERFLKILVGVVKELTGFHRVMIYQFDSDFHGRVVTELVDPRATKDLYRGLHFPASDIPKQARDLYMINKVRLLYDRELTTARLVCKDVEDLEPPLDLTFSYLRAMSPIHLKYLSNMAVRSSMSISINAFDKLWGLVSCHSYGSKGMRVSFPVRNMCRLIGDTASRNIERLSYASRLQARKLIDTMPIETHPSGYVVLSSDDLLDLFEADFGMLTIRKEARILGNLEHSQEALVVLEYLRMRKITSVVSSQDIREDFPDLQYPPGFNIIAGLLLVPLNVAGDDFIVLCRRSHTRKVKVCSSLMSCLVPRRFVGSELSRTA